MLLDPIMIDKMAEHDRENDGENEGQYKCEHSIFFHSITPKRLHVDCGEVDSK